MRPTVPSLSLALALIASPALAGSAADIEVPCPAGDIDSDGDRVPDLAELRVEGSVCYTLDTDGDGTPDHLDDDDDGDGFKTGDEAYDSRGMRSASLDPRDSDFDADGVPDYLDADDDGDGVPTACERLVDPAPDILKFNHRNPDSDDDGIGDLQEWDYVAFAREESIDWDGATCANPQDWDGDGVPDPLDADDDGDGIPTVAEGDRDEDMIAPFSFVCDDADAGGWEGATCTLPASDGSDHPDLTVEGYPVIVPNYLDLDSDGDGVPDSIEGVGDRDRDGIPNYRDCDDCDGCDGDPDADLLSSCIEAELGSNPSSPDTDGDGVRDTFEVDEYMEGAFLNLDTDGDGTPDIRDDDDDGDGKPTMTELGADYDPMTHTGMLDSDCDGIPDYLDPDDYDGPCAGDDDKDDDDDDDDDEEDDEEDDDDGGAGDDEASPETAARRGCASTATPVAPWVALTLLAFLGLRRRR